MQLLTQRYNRTVLKGSACAYVEPRLRILQLLQQASIKVTARRASLSVIPQNQCTFRCSPRGLGENVLNG